MGIVSKIKSGKISMRLKLWLSLSSIAVVLLISSIITVMEYVSMSDYVSGKIGDDIGSINVAQKLSDESSKYNLDILSVIGDETSVRLPDFDQEEFFSRCDALRSSLSPNGVLPLADSVEYSYAAYMLTSLELQDVLVSDFIDSRSWYFERLQPRYNRLREDIDKLTSIIYTNLKKNSATFERGYYRSVIPGIVAVGVGLLLIEMLLFFILTGYVKPIYKMLDSLSAYRSHNKKYTYTFDGDDQLCELNEGVKEIVNENQLMRRRLINRTEGNSETRGTEFEVRGTESETRGTES